MPKSSRGGQGASASQANTAVAQMPTVRKAPIIRNVTPFTDTDAAQVIAQNDSAYGDVDFEYARKMYISAATDSQGFSYSQNLNYKLDNNIPLNANETYMNAMLVNGMRQIGKNTTLFRAAHDDILKSLGVSDYTKMTQAQLQKQLVGTQMKTTAYTSWSYDKSKNPFLPGQPQGGGREVYIINRAHKTTSMFFGAKKQAEVVTNKGTNLKITNVYFDGTYATPRLKGGMRVPRIVIEVDSWG